MKNLVSKRDRVNSTNNRWLSLFGTRTLVSPMIFSVLYWSAIAAKADVWNNGKIVYDCLTISMSNGIVCPPTNIRYNKASTSTSTQQFTSKSKRSKNKGSAFVFFFLALVGSKGANKDLLCDVILYFLSNCNKRIQWMKKNKQNIHIKHHIHIDRKKKNTNNYVYILNVLNANCCCLNCMHLKEENKMGNKDFNNSINYIILIIIIIYAK